MTVDEPGFLSLDEVLYLDAESLARFGGSAGIGDPGLIESALGSARNAFCYGRDDVFGIAAAYAFHITESQAFLDGNKRTGTAAAIMFLKMSGVRFPKDDGLVYAALIDVANKRLDAGLADVFRKLVEKNG